MAHFILTPFGSAGDVNPFLWIGKILRSHGHTVTVIVAPQFETSVRAAGLAFAPVGDERVYREVIENPDLWHPIKGTKTVFTYAGKGALLYFEQIRAVVDASDEKEIALMAPSHAFGARMAREALKLPLITVHLQPSMFVSLHDTPVFAGFEFIIRMPLWLKRLFFSLPNPADTYARKPVAEACRQLGVQPPRSLFRSWWHSPDGVICLFPEWFGPAQPDWPQNARHVGFPLYDLADHVELPAEVSCFLASGENPILVTPGSAMAHGREFFAAALAACNQMNQRALFVTRFPEQLPEDLPDSVLACEYVPFSKVLPFAKAIIHHGGIGTTAQALAAGVPQLIMPMSHDQPDNAARLRRLGVARSLYPKEFTAANVVRELSALLSNSATHSACNRTAEKMAKNTENILLDALNSFRVPNPEIASHSEPSHKLAPLG